jgi:predicted SAM-dependent methyltransferase
MIKSATTHVLKTSGIHKLAGRMMYRIDRRYRGRDQKIVRAYFSEHKIRKLHIGCGERMLEGWLNADYRPASKSILCLDARKPFPLESNTFDYIFSEHMIEHISYTNGLKMLAECFRVLKSSGKVRLSTPDLAFFVKLYRADKSELERDYIQWNTKTFIEWAPEAHETFVINNSVRAWGHQFIYDENTLRKAMESVGFSNIVEQKMQQSDNAALRNLESEERMPPEFTRLETFTLEGTKQ